MGNSLFEVPCGAAFFEWYEKERPTYSQLYQAGKLVDDWSNVKRHCLVQGIGAYWLGQLAGVSFGDSLLMKDIGLIHDARKRIDIRYDRPLRRGEEPLDFTPDEVKRFDSLFRETCKDKSLVYATTPRFLVTAERGGANLLQFLLFFMDDMTKGEEIVTFDERVDEVSARNPNPDPEVEKEL
ncbi:MAG: hypothetical protein G01um101470_306, partial [Parcubacteria group bacterium Gr01-1014_70]